MLYTKYTKYVIEDLKTQNDVEDQKNFSCLCKDALCTDMGYTLELLL